MPLVAMTLAPPSVTDSPGFSDARHRTTRVAVAGRREARVLRIVPPPDDHAGPRIEEAMNLRAMSKPLGPGYGASDLAWGYEYTGERIAMACTNGAVVCWNLERSDSKIGEPPRARRVCSSLTRMQMSSSLNTLEQSTG